jgi:uncharacterized protein
VSVLQVFQDADCSDEVDRVLYEGTTYYLLFPSSDPSTIKSALAVAGIEDSVLWNRRNPVATLRVINRIGLIRLFGKEFDIRSEKFLETETGLRQFQLVLDDLASLSRHILFAPSAAPSANRIHGPELNQPSTLERFNYYRQTCFKKDGRLGLAELVDQIVRNPHSRLIDELIRDHIWNAKKPSRQTLKSLFRHDQSFARLPATHPLAADRPGLKIAGTADILFPLKALRSRGTVSVDTAENRFVKHVLLDVENVCRSAINENLLSGALLNQCHELLNLSRSLLRNNFFQDIGRLQSIPFSSPTLGQRHGYRDLYRIFMRSRMGAKHLFEDIAEDALLIELKDVSLLYEYWVFYKVVASLLKPGALILARSGVVKAGRIVNAAVVSDGEWTVHFNRTYTRKPSGSYSLRLRPDIVIERVGAAGQTTSLHVLDAKYRSVQYTIDDDDDDSLSKIIGVVKPADIQKMHCYIDAIEGVKTASAVYPGNKFVFYPRDRSIPPAAAAFDIAIPSGVGAIPLMPGATNDEFREFLFKIKSGSDCY